MIGLVLLRSESSSPSQHTDPVVRGNGGVSDNETSGGGASLLGSSIGVSISRRGPAPRPVRSQSVEVVTLDKPRITERLGALAVRGRPRLEPSRRGCATERRLLLKGRR